jgi:hypothetical protein
MCFSARLPLADRTGAIASPGPSSLLPLFTEVPRETVWKIGIASNLGSDERATACEEAPFRHLQPPNVHDRERLQLFSVHSLDR